MAVEAAQPPARTRQQLIVWGVWLWAAWAAVFLVLAAFAVVYDYFPSDKYLARRIQGIDVAVLGGFFDALDAVGDPTAYFAITVAVALGLALLRAGWESALVVLTLVPRAANSAIKDWIERPRPSADLVDVSSGASGFSFPSGHAVGLTALFGALFFVIPTVVHPRVLRWPLQLGCLLAVVAVGPARVYEGVHWPSDALGGYLLALLFLLPAVAVYRALRRPAERSQPEAGMLD